MSLISAVTLRSLAALAVLSMLAPPLAAQEAPLKIAVVDLDVVVAQSPAGQLLGAKLERFQVQVRAELEAMAGKMKDLRQRLAAGDSMPASERSELQRQLADEQLKVERLRDDRSREGQAMQSEGLREIELQLQPLFEKIRDENGYDLILNRVPGVVVMAGARVDITQSVVERLRTP